MAMKRYFCPLPIVLSAILFFFGHACAQESAAPDPLPGYNDFVKTHSFPYAVSAEKLSELKENYSSLSIGLNPSQIKAILGEPDYAESLFSKAEEPGFLGTAWTYVLEKTDPRLTNVKTDTSIQVFFNKDGNVQWIVSNTAGLDPIGTPQALPRQAD